MSPFAQTIGKNKKAKAIAATIDKHIKLLNIATTMLVVAFALVYIAQANGAVAKGYQIRELEENIERLTLENQQLEVATRKAQSIDKVAKSTKMLGLIPADQPQYVDGNAPSVALK